MNNIFERILYGIKVANDNIVVLNEKVDEMLRALTYEGEPNGVPGSDNADTNEYHA